MELAFIYCHKLGEMTLSKTIWNIEALQECSICSLEQFMQKIITGKKKSKYQIRSWKIELIKASKQASPQFQVLRKPLAKRTNQTNKKRRKREKKYIYFSQNSACQVPWKCFLYAFRKVLVLPAPLTMPGTATINPCSPSSNIPTREMFGFFAKLFTLFAPCSHMCSQTTSSADLLHQPLARKSVKKVLLIFVKILSSF